MNKRKNGKKPVGRTVKTITVLLPSYLAREIRAKAARKDLTVSQYFRGLVNADFIETGIGPLFALGLSSFLLLAEIYDYFQ